MKTPAVGLVLALAIAPVTLPQAPPGEPNPLTKIDRNEKEEIQE